MRYFFIILVLLFGCKCISASTFDSITVPEINKSRNIFLVTFRVKNGLIKELDKAKYTRVIYFENSFKKVSFSHLKQDGSNQVNYYSDTTLSDRRQIFDETLRKKCQLFSRKKIIKNRLLANHQMIGMMNAMLLKPDKEGMELLTYMMVKMLQQYSRKDNNFILISKWFEGSIYLFNADQKRRIGKAINK